MNTSRRLFIRNSSIAIAGSAMLPQILLAKNKMTNHVVGLQLYTVRDDMQKDPAGTLKKVAAIGFRYVEHAGYHAGKFYGYSIPDFKKILNDNGLVMDSGHTFLGSEQWNKSTKDFTDEWKQTMADAAAVGMKYVISPGVDESLCKNMDDFKMYMDMFNKSGELAKSNGIHFAFHNENYEFNHSLDGTVLYDLLLSMADKNLVAQQIDIGNMYEPGGRAMHYLEKYPGRFMLMHVKNEMKKDPPSGNGHIYESTTLKSGVIDVKKVIETALQSGTKYFIIEQEEYQGKAPLDAAKDDLQTMKDWGF